MDARWMPHIVLAALIFGIFAIVSGCLMSGASCSNTAGSGGTCNNNCGARTVGFFALGLLTGFVLTALVAALYFFLVMEEHGTSKPSEVVGIVKGAFRDAQTVSEAQPGNYQPVNVQ